MIDIDKLKADAEKFKEQKRVLEKELDKDLKIQEQEKK